MSKKSGDVYGRLSDLIFSGEYEMGSNLAERNLATRLGVSRIPVREILVRLVAQGTLEGGAKGEGVRMRRYTADEIRQLYDFRAIIEGGVARSAAMSASQADILRLSIICDEMESVLEGTDAKRWGTLDRQFHEALAEAARNDRFEKSLKNLLHESFYVFYMVARKRSISELSADEMASHQRLALDDHRAIVEHVTARSAEEAESRARLHILRSADRVIRAAIENDLGG